MAIYTNPNSAKAFEPVTYTAIVEGVYAGFVPATALPLLAVLALAIMLSAALQLPRTIAQRLQMAIDAGQKEE